MKLVAFICNNVNKRIPERAGYANGYVAIPKDHPYHGMDYDDLDLEVHSGITYAAYAGGVDNFPETEFLDEGIIDLEGYWVLGFDTIHYEDNLERWPRERVVEETLKLKKQLQEAYDKVH